MCYICGNLDLVDSKHLEKKIHSLDGTELNDIIIGIKNKMKTLEKFPLGSKEDTSRAVSELRKTLLILIGEKLSRFKA